MNDQPQDHVDKSNDEHVPALAALEIGDRVPWKLDASGEPQWLTVVAVEGPGIYLVRDPSGNVERLSDSQ